MAVDPWSIVRHVHKLGSPISGIVTRLESFDLPGLPPSGHIHLDTESQFPAVLPYDWLTDEQVKFEPSLLPAIGDQIDAVIFNFAGGKLYLTTQPRALAPEQIAKWQRYYDYIETVQVGDLIIGVVKESRHFGLFVDIGSEFLGLIDLGLSLAFNLHPLPSDPLDWPIAGDRIQCKVAYLRLHNRQIGLDWLPQSDDFVSRAATGGEQGT